MRLSAGNAAAAFDCCHAWLNTLRVTGGPSSVLEGQLHGGLLLRLRGRNSALVLMPYAPVFAAAACGVAPATTAHIPRNKNAPRRCVVFLAHHC